MKKNLIIKMLLAYAVPSFAWNPTSKGYIELGLGAGRLHVESKGYSDYTNKDYQPPIDQDFREYQLPSLRSGSAKPAGIAQAILGFDHRFPCSQWVLGIYGGGGYTGSNHKAPYSAKLLKLIENFGIVLSPSYDETFYATIRPSGFIRAGLRMGYQIGCFLPLINLGWRMDHYRVAFSRLNASNANQKISKKHWLQGMIAALGLEYALSKSWVMGASLEMAANKSKKFDFSNKLDWANNIKDGGARVKASPSINQLLLTLKYVFY